MVRSSEPEATSLPSGDHAIAITRMLCAVYARRTAPSWRPGVGVLVAAIEVAHPANRRIANASAPRRRIRRLWIALVIALPPYLYPAMLPGVPILAPALPARLRGSGRRRQGIVSK